MRGARELSHAAVMRGFVVAALVSIVPVEAAADGEATPMIGGSVVWSPTDQNPSGMIGAALEAAWWHGRIGVAVEGSGRTFTTDGDKPRALTFGTSLRLRMFDGMYPSLMEPRDVEVGIELQAIVERFWWEGHGLDDPHVGLGVALRVRGGADDGSTRIAESRFFLRVMAAPGRTDEVIARSTTTMLPSESRDLMLLLGIGASFGGGDPRYVNRFRWRGPDWPIDQRGGSRLGADDSTF
jgi:hypothetical protein